MVLSTLFICLLSGILGFVPQSAQSQIVSPCGITAATEKLNAAHPELVSQRQKANAYLEAETQAKMADQNTQQDACNQVFVIPVVFHIIHENGAENISDQTVFDAIRILNEDYRLWNADTADVIADFKPIMGDAMIDFRLAQIDPFGSPTNGIDRIQSPETNEGDDDSKLNPWPRSKYLNIWTVKASPSGAAAYAYLPSSVSSGFDASIDGIIARYTYIGEGERTLTHEVGHWMNLLHVWGSGNDAGLSTNCAFDDNVGDTPYCIGTSGGCNTAYTTCGSLDNVQNYMDYASCEMMFTEGQVSRMRVALTSSTAQRNLLSMPSNLIATGVYEGAVQFSASLTQVCAGAEVLFTDASYNGICQWEWAFEGGTPATSDLRTPTVVYDYPGTYDVTLTVSNDTGTATITLQDYMEVIGAETLPYSEDYTGGSDWPVSGIGGPTWEYTSFTYEGAPGCMAIYNYGQGSSGEMDEMLSPPIDLSILQSGQITFEVAYAQIDLGTNDLLRVHTSGDCGTTWNSSWISGGVSLASPNGQLTSNFVPVDVNDWKSVTVNLTPQVMTPDFRFKFEFTSDAGNNVFIDNIKIVGTYNSTPLLVSPVNFAENEPMTVTMDWNAIDNVDYYDYRIDTVHTLDSPYLISGTSNYINNSDNGTDTEYLMTGLDSGMVIFWSVRTRTNTDTSNWSAIWRYTTVPSVFDGIEMINASVAGLVVFPNPSDGNVTVGFDLDRNYEHITLQIFDVLGREIQIHSPSSEPLSAGHHELKVNTIRHGGVYYLRLNIDESSFFSRFTIAK